MDNDEQRDYAEEKYNRNMCPCCEHSPCVGKEGKGSCEQMAVEFEKMLDEADEEWWLTVD